MGELDAVIAEEIARRRAAPDLAERDDVLSMLLRRRHEDDGSPMTDAELRDELVTLLVAGHETTATALSWALERLARHPDAWARLRSGDEPYLDAVIKETLRLRPVLPIVLRRLKAPMEIGGWELPAGVARRAVHLPHAPPRPTSTPTRSRSARSASSSSPPAPTPGSRSAAACAAASARASRSSRWPRCCACSRAAARAWSPTALVPERIARRSITLVPAREGARRGRLSAGERQRRLGRGGEGAGRGAVNVDRGPPTPLR